MQTGVERAVVARSDAASSGAATSDERCSGGDLAAFERLYDLTADRVHGLVTAVTGDAEVAEEVTHAVFLEAWHDGGWRHASASPTGWIVALAHRRAVERVRCGPSALDRSGGVSAASARPLDNAGGATADPVAAAMWSIPDEQRLLVHAAFFDGCSDRELEALLGMPHEAVETGVRAGLRTLGRLLVGERAA